MVTISIKDEMERLTETGKFTPYPNMTDDDLSEFERYEYETFGVKPLYQWDWAKEQDATLDSFFTNDTDNKVVDKDAGQ